MPRGPCLLLLGVQREEMPYGVTVIESDAAWYRRKARAAQALWFSDPDSLERCRDYAYSLLDLADKTANRRMRRFARSLLAARER